VHGAWHTHLMLLHFENMMSDIHHTSCNKYNLVQKIKLMDREVK
jgi:hypothetical protein